jgi:AraC-like DNA-binding protein
MAHASNPSNGSTRLWRAPDVLDAVMLKGRFVRHRYPLHAHDTHCLALITSGSLVVNAAGHEALLRRGDIVSIDADTLHAGHAGPSGSWKMRVAHFHAEDLAAYTESVGLPVRSQFAVAAPVLRDATLAQWLYGISWCSEVNEDPFKRSETLAAAIGRLVALHAAQPVQLGSPRLDSRVIRAVKEQLHAELGAKLTLPALAAAHGVMPFTLLRAFVRSTGLSPHAYQQQVRIRYAHRRLRVGATPAVVAGEAGYADQAHFTRVFKQYTGVTPRAFQLAVMS